MTDLVKLKLQAGGGGNGRVSFRREKYIPKGGPDGGHGGDGGSVIIKATNRYNTLSHFAGAKEFAAQAGELGGKRRQSGKKGADLVLEVPVGTTIWLLAENQSSYDRTRHFGVSRPLYHKELHFQKYYLDQEGGRPLARKEQSWLWVDAEEPAERIVGQPGQEDEFNAEQDAIIAEYLDQNDLKQIPKLEMVTLTEIDQEVVVSQGGYGGRGNESFKGPTKTTPFEAEFGTPGEVKVVLLELKLLADIGLVGFPNAGKSTLLSHLTQARPKVANYPFTTLEPQLGVMSVKDRELVIADIPGLIEGAHEGKGLGYAFLRHIENCRLLLFVLALTEEDIFNEALNDKDKALLLWQQYEKLATELNAYNQMLATKPLIVGINKLDLYSTELIDAFRSLFKKHKLEVQLFSGVTGVGLDELKVKLLSSFSKLS